MGIHRFFGGGVKCYNTDCAIRDYGDGKYSGISVIIQSYPCSLMQGIASTFSKDLLGPLSSNVMLSLSGLTWKFFVQE